MNIRDSIEFRMLQSQNVALQNKCSWQEEQLSRCVSQDKYNAACSERDLAVSECKSEKEARIKAEERATQLKDENISLKREIQDYRERIAALERQNSDLMDELDLARDEKFAPSSEKMEDFLGEEKPLPDSKAGVLATIAQLVHEADVAMGLDKEEAKEKYKPVRGKDTKKRKPRSSSSLRRGVYTEEVLKSLGIDTTGVDPSGKVILRNDRPDIWWFIMYYVARPRVYSIKYAITRYNLPGSGFQNSAYPPGIFEKCHLSPSFAALYFRMKFCYNVSEQNIIRALSACGCRMPQATLNKYIQEIEDVLMSFMLDAMKQEIRDSRFTHNDETRLRVKGEIEKEGIVSYHNEYIHGILSPSCRLMLMLYRKGSRAHDIQEEIFDGSSIECFVADKAKMYPKIVRDVGQKGTSLVRGSCWVHGRREIFDAAKTDSRMIPILKLIQFLLRMNAKWREDGLSEQECLKKRQDEARPIVEAIFFRLRLIMSMGNEYGETVRKAVQYILNDEEGFTAFLKNGLLELDNNAIERCFRHIAMGRRTWLFTGSHESAERLAFMYSLEESCRMNGLDFGDYIEYVLERIQAGEKDARSLLPNRIAIPEDWMPEGTRLVNEAQKSA